MAYFTRKTVLLSATAIIALASGSALADEKSKSGEIVIAQAGPAAPAASSDEKIEKVTVTATRRKTSLQKTAVAVTAVGEQTIKDSRVENIEDLMAVVPSLQVTNGGNPAAFTVRIRGVGTQGNNAGLEAAVGTFIDGVYRSRASVAFGDLGELERIEVLRGPQGTLFGRNTSAGILSVLTKKPSFEGNETWVEATGGSFDQFAVKGGANVVAIPDKLAFRLFGTRHEQEGFIDVNPGRPDAYDGNAKSYYALRGQALWQLGEKADFRFIADFAKRDDQCCSAATIDPGGPGRASAPPPGVPSTSGASIINYLEAPFLGKAITDQVDEQVAYGNRSTNNHIEDKGFSGELNWDLGGATLTSITAQRDWTTTYAQDSDFSGADILYFADDDRNLTKFETFTHEMRLTGELDWVDWLVGGFYSDEDITRNATLLNGFELERYLSLHRIGNTDIAVAPFTSLRGTLAAVFGHSTATPVWTGGLGNDDLYKQNSESFALFTHNIFHLTDSVDLTAGLRWTTETKVFDATYRSFGMGGCTTVENTLGLNPGAAAGALAGLVGLTCLPGSRHALDVLTAAKPHHQEREETEFSGIATLAWEIKEDLNTYATYSRGHKAGGFNLDRSFADAAGSIVRGAGANTVIAGVITPTGAGPCVAGPGEVAAGTQCVRGPDTSFPAEFVDAFELGLKTSLANDTFFLNTALFYQTFENFQLNTFTGISFIVTSVPEVISQGVEIEATWRTPVKGLNTNFAIQYTDAHYGEIGDITIPTSFLGRNPGLFLLKDATITHSPELTLTGGFNYEFPLFSTLTGLFHMDARWQSEMNTGSNLDPRKAQDAFAVVGLKFAVYTEDDRYGLEFFARNLFDERYINTAFDAPLQGSSITPTAAATSTIDAFLGEPRMIGFTLRARH
jgi:iron complex outermembrane recepter protein